jgi:anion-transporting  ArsA/GET3 family ATPase
MIPAFGRKLLVVTGKGGVGRSTVTAALAVAAARAGKVAVALELDGNGALPPLLGVGGREFEPRHTPAGPYVSSFSVYGCLEDFGRRKLRMGPLASVVFQARVVHTLIDGIPGLHDALQLGKLQNLVAEPAPGDVAFDLGVLDAPATGHGLTLLAAAETLAELTRVGPFYEEARVIDAFLADPARTGVVVVALAEDLAVREAIDLIDALPGGGRTLAAVVVNRVVPPVLADDAVSAALSAAARAGGRDDVAALAAATHDRSRRQRDALAWLGRALEERGVTAPIATLPAVPGPLDPSAIARLGAALEVALG